MYKQCISVWRAFPATLASKIFAVCTQCSFCTQKTIEVTLEFQFMNISQKRCPNVNGNSPSTSCALNDNVRNKGQLTAFIQYVPLLYNNYWYFKVKVLFLLQVSK